MLVNREVYPIGRKDPDFKGGLEVFDVSTPSKPRHIATWQTRGMHRFTFDGRYVYGSPEMDGYLGNIVQIIDFAKPDKPEEVGRWWMPGQWAAGGETPTWKGTDHRCHHPMRVGNRLYTSYWHGGFVILNIDDMTKPKFVSGLDWSPPFPWPTHTALPVPFLLRGRRVMLVADEDVGRLAGPTSPSFLWLVDITDETRPMPFASFQVEDEDGLPKEDYTGLHQFCEDIRSTEIPIAWFARGLRIVDIANPHAPKQVASFMPPVPEGLDARLAEHRRVWESKETLRLVYADYYREYARLMQHWYRLFPDAIFPSSYEALVSNPTARITEMLAFLGLAPEEDCFHPERSSKSVRTASALQLRNPINASSVGRWKSYETQLAVIHEKLGPEINTFGAA